MYVKTTVFGMWSIWLNSGKHWAPSVSSLNCSAGLMDQRLCLLKDHPADRSLQHVRIQLSMASCFGRGRHIGKWSEQLMATFILKNTEHFFVVVCDLALDYLNSCIGHLNYKLQPSWLMKTCTTYSGQSSALSMLPHLAKNVKTIGFWQLQPPLFIYNTSGNSGFSFLANKLTGIAFW